MRSRLPSRPLRLALALGLAAIGSYSSSPAEELKLSPAATRMKADVAYLADDAREGRAPGTRGIEAAADYIADQFRQAGLTPPAGSDGYFQAFTVAGDQTLTGDTALTIARDGRGVELKPEVAFTSLSSRGGTVKAAPLAFAGYGITARDQKRKLDYDDYDGLDAKGKVVLVFRHEPQKDDPDSPFDGKDQTEYATFRSKATNASEHGAVAVLLVNSKASLDGKPDELLPDGSAGRLAVPVLMIAREAADDLLKRADMPGLDELESGIDADLKPRSREMDGLAVDAAIDLARTQIRTKNVVGVLEGSGPSADETIVIGAHYDHLGRGGAGSLASGSRDIHNGADDNASGTAMVMEMARRLASRRLDPLPRRIVFVAFSGEERGLLGSQHYVKAPPYPLKDTVVMINFDMVGRLNDKGELTVFGAGSTPGLDELIDALGKTQGLAIKKVAGTGGEFFASDHASFYLKDIPVFFAFTGNHKDYHRPSDDTEWINFVGMDRIADVGELLLLDLAHRPERPAFVKLPSGGGRSVGAVRSGQGAYLGTRPSYGESDEPGVKLDGVSEGSPAEKAGLKAEDIIIKFDDKDVKDIEDFMEGLSKHKPGDTVEVVVKRGGKETPVSVTLGRRPSGPDRD